MTLFDWLSTTQGIQLTHAVIVLLIAVTGFINYKTHQSVVHVQRNLNNHVNGENSH